MEIEMLKTFIIDGKYHEMLSVKKRMELIKDYIEKTLCDKEINFRRFEWRNIGIVAKYIKVNKYKWDREGLNDLLDSVGILPLVCIVDEKLLTSEEQLTLSPFILKERKTLRYITNISKNIVDGYFLNQLNSNDYSLEYLLSYWKKLNCKYRILASEWKCLKENAVLSRAFNTNSKIQWKYGTFSLQSKLEYDTLKICESNTREVLIKGSKIKVSALDQFLAKGLINKGDIETFRIIESISVKFILMDKSSDEKINEYLDNRRMRLSELNCGD